MRKWVILLAAALAAAGFTAGQVSASSKLQLGIFDDPQVLGRPDQTFPLLTQLRVQVIRVTLHWGGPIGVAGDKRPKDATDPADPAYDWFPYDRAVEDADAAGIKVLFSIVDTPHWANGDRGINRAPTKMSDLRDFAYAAAKRYSGFYVPDGRRRRSRDDDDGGRAAAGRPALARLERAEQPGLPAAAVGAQEGQVGREQPGRLREALPVDLHRRPPDRARRREGRLRRDGAARQQQRRGIAPLDRADPVPARRSRRRA